MAPSASANGAPPPFFGMRDFESFPERYGWSTEDDSGYKIKEQLYATERPLRVVALGAGMGGICLAKFLSDQLKNVSLTIYDKNPEVAGTWYENSRRFHAEADKCSAWSWPKIEGLFDFKGKLCHTAAYDESIDLDGKRVAVLGMGSSGVQAIPAVLGKASKLYTWIRSPTWITAGFAQKYAGPGGTNFKCSSSIADEEYYKSHTDWRFALVPNYFTLGGPYFSFTVGSYTSMAELFAKNILQVIKKMQRESIKSLAPRKDVCDEFVKHADLWIRRTAWNSPCSNWFKNTHPEKIAIHFPASKIVTTDLLLTPRFEDYLFEYWGNNRWEFLGNGFAALEYDGGDVTWYLGTKDNPGGVLPENVKALNGSNAPKLSG
ncbi:unnamed protein product [Sphagnum balticum]